MKKSVLLLFAIIMAITCFAQQWISKQQTNGPQTPPTVPQGITITPTGNELWWGYFMENDANASNFTGVGVSAKADYEAAIRIPANHTLLGEATIKAIRVWIGNDNLSKTKSLKVWIAKTLTNNAVGAEYVQEVDVSSLSAGANDIALNTPYNISNDQIYVGFTMGLSSQAYAVMNGGEWVENSFYIRASASVTEWGPLSNFGKLALQILVDGVDVSDNAASPADFGMNYVLKGENVNVPVKITNKGKKDVTSISYTITTNGNTSPETTIRVSNISFNNSKIIDIPFAADNDTRKYNKTLTITKVNGKTNEAAASEQSSNGQLITILEKPTVVPVVEEFTGTWCGWCPVGFDGMEKAHETFGDNVVLIAVHSGDVMQISDYNPVSNSVGSFPSSHIDRSIDAYPSASNLIYYINQCLNKSTVGKIDVSARWVGDDMNAIDIHTKTQFVYSDDDAKYGIALVLIEDGLHGTGSGWAQSNYLSHRSGYESLSFWYNAGSSVSGLNYDHVAVAAWNIKNGANNSIKSSFTAGEIIKYNYEADISNKSLIQDKSKLKVVALLIDRTDGRIANAAQATIREASAISTVYDSDATEVERYDINGHKLLTPQAGINIVKMSDGTVRKVLVK